jgi:hypothetical protein
MGSRDTMNRRVSMRTVKPSSKYIDSKDGTSSDSDDLARHSSWQGYTSDSAHNQVHQVHLCTAVSAGVVLLHSPSCPGDLYFSFTLLPEDSPTDYAKYTYAMNLGSLLAIPVPHQLTLTDATPSS